MGTAVDERNRVAPALRPRPGVSRKEAKCTIT